MTACLSSAGKHSCNKVTRTINLLQGVNRGSRRSGVQIKPGMLNARTVRRCALTASGRCALHYVQCITPFQHTSPWHHLNARKPLCAITWQIAIQVNSGIQTWGLSHAEAVQCAGVGACTICSGAVLMALTAEFQESIEQFLRFSVHPAGTRAAANGRHDQEAVSGG